MSVGDELWAAASAVEPSVGLTADAFALAASAGRPLLIPAATAPQTPSAAHDAASQAESLLERFAETEVGISRDGEPAASSRMTLRELVLKREDPSIQGLRAAVCADGLRGTDAGPASMVAAPPFARELHTQGKGRTSFVFVGRDYINAGHYHPNTHAVLVQGVGQKDVLLFPPGDCGVLELQSALRPVFWHTQIDFNAAGLGAYPKLRKARPLRATLHPGDALFIPVHWLHVVFARGWTVSTTFFWNAPLRDWAFPNPGLRTLAATSLQTLWWNPIARGLAWLGLDESPASRRLFGNAGEERVS